ncbi:MAG: hypothetical protein LBD38_03320 [Streptococcaceae bacterium]|jgi:hypothetical protein|nr:hypothetical protein [Streptococcaceae bacterium]
MKKVVVYNLIEDAFVFVEAIESDGRLCFENPALLEEVGLLERSNEIQSVLEEDTFAIVVGQTIESQTFNQWEALRVSQAFHAIKKEMEASGKLAHLPAFEQITEDIVAKYNGKRSWNDIYQNLYKVLA